ncbi:hypothetical protein [uncultured Erythrobacter sp.]|uniref:hypothetical protein n=1 Tax=uncultured Erythrobacter sp. TaxID=263913 RepID=UPI002621C8D2|nr:hypothetical protein [uncultured Erythrobacter sp.]
MKFRPIILAVLPPLMLAACGDEAASDGTSSAVSSDPLLARALNDPLMVDPDLAYRNEANAAITIRHDHALPLFEGSDEAAQRAREEARLQLLEAGSVLDLPNAAIGEGVGSLAGETTAPGMINAIGGPAACTESLSEGFEWAARLPDAAQVMPHGMVQQAAGGSASGCSVRVVRYLTPATIEDALEYHYNRAHRAQLRVERFSKPEQIVRASRGSTQFIVHARPAPNNMSAVDLIYWQR